MVAEIGIVHRALTIRQPWVHGIFHHGKDIENRTWPIPETAQSLFGLPFWILVHAGATTDLRGATYNWPTGVLMPYAEMHVDICNVPTPVMVDRQDGEPDGVEINTTTSRAGVGIVRVTGCHQAEEGCCDSIWGIQPDSKHKPIWHWTLRDPIKFPMPITNVRGAQGLWQVPSDLNATIMERLSRR